MDKKDAFDIIFRLKFISKIKFGEKINSKTLAIYDSSLYHKICRSLICRENKWDTYVFLEKTFHESISYLEQNINSDDRYVQARMISILEELELSKAGVLNIIETYKYFSDLTTKIETLIQWLDNKISSNDNIAKLKKKKIINDF